ncbi:hypothetical protein E2320_000117, partial [Naja naja]
MQSSDFEKNIIFMFPTVENIKNPHHFQSRVFLEELPQGISQNLGRSQFRQKTYILTQSSDFEKHFIFMFPRVENIENPLYFHIRDLPEELARGKSQNNGVENFKIPHHFRFWVFPEELQKGISQNVGLNSITRENITFNSDLGFRKEAYFYVPHGWKTLKIHFIFRSELSLRSYPKAYLKMSSDFKKHFMFMFPRVENIENPLYFRIRALPEELAQGKSQNIRSQILKRSLFSSSPRWKILKIHIIFRSELSLKSYPKAYLKMVGWKMLKIHTIFGSELSQELAQGISQNSSDFEKNIIFLFPTVENIKNPHHFQSRVFLEELPQGISQN